MIHHNRCDSVSSVFIGPYSHFLAVCRQYPKKSSNPCSNPQDFVQGIGLEQLVKLILNSCFRCCCCEDVSYHPLASALVSSLGSRVTFGGHLFESPSQSGPFCHSLLSTQVSLQNRTFWRRRRKLLIMHMPRNILAASFGGEAAKTHSLNASCIFKMADGEQREKPKSRLEFLNFSRLVVLFFCMNV